MTRRTADIIALTVAVIVAIAALLLMDVGADVDAPSTTTTVTKDAVAESESSTTTTTVTPAAQGGAQGQTTVLEKTNPARPSETTTTKTMGERSFLERVLGNNGVVVLQLGAVLLAAFAAGAVTQRVLLGEYGFKLGTFELSAIAVPQLRRWMRSSGRSRRRSRGWRRRQTTG